MSMAILFSFFITVSCTTEEIPSWVNELGPGAAEFWSRASALGLPEDCVRDLMKGLEADALRFEKFVELSECWLAKGVNLLDFLRETVESRVLPLGAFGYDPGISQVKVLSCVAYSRDPAATDWVIEHVREELNGPIQSRTDVDYLVGLLRGPLSHVRSRDAVDFLVEVQTEAFWCGEDAPHLDMAAIGRLTSEHQNAYAVTRIRTNALRAIGESGTEYAIEVLATGDDIEFCGIELESAFRDAVRRHLGIWTYPEMYGWEMPEETLAQIQEIYSKYGKTYEPVTPPEGYETLSPPHF